MARVHHSFTMDGTPDAAQDMFGRDIVPDLHKDGDFSVLTDQNGYIELVEGPLAASSTSLEAVADPDIVGHPEEDTEPDVRAVTSPRIEEERIPFGRLVGGMNRREGVLASYSHHLAITFAPEGQATRVTIEGHAPRAIRDGLQRLGTPGHWPEIAGRPHD